MSRPWIVEHADGTLTQHDARPGTAGIAPGVRRVQVDRPIDFAREQVVWSTGKIEPRLDVWRAELLAAVDEQREAARRPYMTQLLGQSAIYANKAREVADYRSLLANVLTALTVPQRRQRFPFAMAEVDVTGETLPTVIARFEAGAAQNQALGRIEAKATHAKVLIRAATTLDAMKAAAAVDWEK